LTPLVSMRLVTRAEGRIVRPQAHTSRDACIPIRPTRAARSRGRIASRPVRPMAMRSRAAACVGRAVSESPVGSRRVARRPVTRELTAEGVTSKERLETESRIQYTVICVARWRRTISTGRFDLAVQRPPKRKRKMMDFRGPYTLQS